MKRVIVLGQGGAEGLGQSVGSSETKLCAKSNRGRGRRMSAQTHTAQTEMRG